MACGGVRGVGSPPGIRKCSRTMNMHPSVTVRNMWRLQMASCGIDVFRCTCHWQAVSLQAAIDPVKRNTTRIEPVTSKDLICIHVKPR